MKNFILTMAISLNDREALAAVQGNLSPVQIMQQSKVYGIKLENDEGVQLDMDFREEDCKVFTGKGMTPPIKAEGATETWLHYDNLPLYTVPKEIAEKAESLAAEIDAFKKGSK